MPEGLVHGIHMMEGGSPFCRNGVTPASATAALFGWRQVYTCNKPFLREALQLNIERGKSNVSACNRAQVSPDTGTKGFIAEMQDGNQYHLFRAQE